MQECCTRDELAELDRLQASSRELLVDAYERSVAESMEALADCFAAALARDLVTRRRLQAGGSAFARSAPSAIGSARSDAELARRAAAGSAPGAGGRARVAPSPPGAARAASARRGGTSAATGATAWPAGLEPGDEVGEAAGADRLRPADRGEHVGAHGEPVRVGEAVARPGRRRRPRRRPAPAGAPRGAGRRARRSRPDARGARVEQRPRRRAACPAARPRASRARRRASERVAARVEHAREPVELRLRSRRPGRRRPAPPTSASHWRSCTHQARACSP